MPFSKIASRSSYDRSTTADIKTVKTIQAPCDLVCASLRECAELHGSAPKTKQSAVTMTVRQFAQPVSKSLDLHQQAQTSGFSDGKMTSWPIDTAALRFAARGQQRWKILSQANGDRTRVLV